MSEDRPDTPQPAWRFSGAYASWRDDWLARHEPEDVLQPQLPIVDAHHHLWNRPDATYLAEQLLADVGSGHRIESTVYVDCRSMYRASGPQEFRSVGEVEFANGVAAMGASGEFGPTRMCEGIVGFGSLHLGSAAQEVLQALVRAGGGRFKGVRHVSAWDADPQVARPNPDRPPGLLARPGFRAGFALLGPMGLSFDAYLMQTQIDELTDLARAFPDTAIVLDHLGQPLGVHSYAGRRDELFGAWRKSMAELAGCPNVVVKLGGLGMVLPGFGFHERERPPDSQELAVAWRPHIETAIELFGPRRCMFESNFPPDKGTCSYRVLWNAFKRIAAAASAAEKRELFAGTARRFYRLPSAADGACTQGDACPN
jgi:predicted TIM-barrel fold metal-dependent hydrolase